MNTILNTIAFGGLLKYPRKPNLIIGELVKEYNPGDILDANATVQMISYYMQNLPYDNIREEFMAYRANSELHFQALDEAVRALQQQSGSDFTDLQEKVAALTERVETIKTQLQPVDLTGMRADINQLKVDTLQNSTDISTLKNEVDYIKIHGTTSPELTALIAWKNSITQADTDNVINKWGEIVKFLAGISSTTDLTHILAGKQDKLTASSGIKITGNTVAANMYTAVGLNVDGSMTQKATTDAINASTQSFKTYVDGKLTAKQDKLTAGNGITITNNKIDCTVPKVTVDPAINATSTNPVQNKAVSAALDAKQNKLIAGSGITIEANGTIKATGTSVVIDSALSPTSTNPVQNKVINTALDAKQNKLTAGEHINITGNTIKATWTVDSAVAASGVNAVSGKAVHDYVEPVKTSIAAKQDKLKAGAGITIEADGTIKATGTSVVIDNALNAASTNPVQNKVVTASHNAQQAEIIQLKNDKQNKLTAGTGIQISATNVISATAQPITVATAVTATETKPVSGKAVYDFANPIKVESAQNKTDITQIKANKQNKLTAGPGINIVGDTISATGTSVTVDNTITPTGANPVSGKAVNDFVTPVKTELASVKTSKQDKLTAGTGINIVGNIISATGTSVTVDNTVTPTGANPVSGKAVTDYVAHVKTDITQIKSGKQDKITAGTGIVITGNSIAAKLYTATGTAVDGSMTQKAITDAINAKADKSYVDTKLNTKQDKLIAGSNITITGNTISAAGGSTVTIDSTVTPTGTNAVSGKAVNDFVQPVKTQLATKQDKLIAGTNITITGNTISSTGGGTITVDGTVTPTGANAVSGKAVHDYIEPVKTSVTTALTQAKQYTDTKVATKQDKLTAGANITISGNTISSTGGSVTVDDYLDSDSENPVQNKVITDYITKINVKNSQGSYIHNLTLKSGTNNRYNFTGNISSNGDDFTNTEHYFLLYTGSQLDPESIYKIRLCGKFTDGIYYTDMFFYDGKMCYGYINDNISEFILTKAN